MCNSKLLLEQINLKSEKWIRGMEIVENNFETDIFLNLKRGGGGEGEIIDRVIALV